MEGGVAALGVGHQLARGERLGHVPVGADGQITLDSTVKTHLVADVVGRVVVRPGELGVGTVTAILGAPVFIALVRRQRLAGL